MKTNYADCGGEEQNLTGPSRRELSVAPLRFFWRSLSTDNGTYQAGEPGKTGGDVTGP
jgi:hypothetical protein